MLELLRQMQRTQQLQQEQINEQNKLQRESQTQQIEQQRMLLDVLREERRPPTPVTGMDQAVASAMQRQADALEQQNIALEKQNYLSEQQLGRRENQGNGHSLRTLKDLPEFDGRNGPSVVKFMKQFERCKESENWGNRDAIKWLKLSLTGIAREEFENTRNHVTFLDAKEALFTRYLTCVRDGRGQDLRNGL
ncbi:MAG: hypothetical protein GY696_24725, partial [Gammaproteobacteria bacterium]|nr:hypothetical protein [Gammaproteobacteria bacterium]